MSILKGVKPQAATQVPEPPIARFLFADTRMAWFWLIVRLYVGYEWFTAGWEKLTGTDLTFGKTFNTYSADNQWVFTHQAGAAISGFVKSALTKVASPTNTHPQVQDWYASFLKTFVQPYPEFWAYLITFGELAVGVGLLVGCLTGIAATFGMVMNLNYLLAGTVSTNPILGFLALFLILAWRIAGYYGVDRYLLPMLGTPWTGSLKKKEQANAPRTSQPAAMA